MAMQRLPMNDGGAVCAFGGCSRAALDSGVCAECAAAFARGLGAAITAIFNEYAAAGHGVECNCGQCNAVRLGVLKAAYERQNASVWARRGG